MPLILRRVGRGKDGRVGVHGRLGGTWLLCLCAATTFSCSFIDFCLPVQLCVEESESAIRSIELQLVRVETVGACQDPAAMSACLTSRTEDGAL